MSKFQRALRQLHLMVSGYHPPKRPSFLTDDELEIRRAVARDMMGDTQPKGRFAPRKPIDLDDGLPIG